MKKIYFIIFALSLILSNNTFGQSEVLLLFQGEIANQSRQLLDGPDTYNVTFSIWDSLTGGNQLWSQQINDVVIQKGVLSILLGGTAAPFSQDLFSGAQRYLQLTITKGGNSETLAPRMTVTSSLYMIAGTDLTSCPTGMTRVTNFCIDINRRGPVSEFNAMKNCFDRNMSLCQWTQIMHACELKLLDVNSSTPLSTEWIAGTADYIQKATWGVDADNLPYCYRLNVYAVVWNGADRLFYYRCCK